MKPLHGRLLVLGAIVSSALVLRLAVTSFSPLADQLQQVFGFSTTVVGVFGMMPPLIFAISGMLTPTLAVRIGLEPTVIVAMAMAGVGMAARAMVPSSSPFATWYLLALSALALGGMGIGNVVIPPLVKRYFSDRLAMVSSLYIVCVQIGTIAPAFLAVPVADAAGWRISLGMWAVIPFLALIPWLVVNTRWQASTAASTNADATAREGPRPSRSPVGWSMAVMFGMTSTITYAMFAWIPMILADAGASAAFGGAMVGLFAMIGLFAAFTSPMLCARMVNPFPVVVVCAACFVVSFLGLLLAPMGAPILWIVLLGLGPSTFPMALTLINLRTRTHLGSASLSGFAQGVGYLLAAAGPLAFGVLHEMTQNWGASFAFLFVCVAILLAAGSQACRPRMLEDTPFRSATAGRGPAAR